jgi:hypothetical protein
MDVLAEGARRMAAAAVAPSASPFVMDTPNVIGLLLSALVAFISGPGGQGGSSFYVCVFCVLLKLPLAEAAGTAAFVVFAGSVASALSAMGRLNPASAKPAPLIDYDSGAQAHCCAPLARAVRRWPCTQPRTCCRAQAAAPSGRRRRAVSDDFLQT